MSLNDPIIGIIIWLQGVTIHISGGIIIAFVLIAI